MGAMSFTHILLVAVVVLLVFGPKRLPDLGKALGESIRDFKKGLVEPADYKEVKTAELKSDETKKESSLT
jgi:sec-independent protein translocase protein TatA